MSSEGAHMHNIIFHFTEWCQHDVHLSSTNAAYGNTTGEERYGLQTTYLVT